MRLLQKDLSQNGIRSKTGNHIISRGSLYKLLSNPIYIGQIRHKNICHAGQHEGIIDQVLWERVQQHMDGNTIGEKTQSRKTEAALLAGKLFDASGERVVPIHANKNGRRYRYYISQSLTTAPADTAISGWRLPGREIEHVVVHAASQLLQDGIALTTALQEAGIKTCDIPAALSHANNMATTTEKMERIITRVELRKDGLRLTLALDGKGMTVIHDIPMLMKRRGVEMRMVVGGHGPTRTDPTLVKTIARAHKWFQELVTCRVATLAEIAKRESMNLGDVSRTLNLAFLAPDIVEGIIAGRQPAELSAQKLLRRTNLPLEWAQQRSLLGF